MSEKQRKIRGGVQFKPGQSGNPKGRPKKGYSITEAFKAMFAAQPEVKAQLVQSIKEKALKGDPAAQKMIWEYMDGKPKQPITGGDEDDNPITTRVIVEFATGQGKDS